MPQKNFSGVVGSIRSRPVLWAGIGSASTAIVAIGIVTIFLSPYDAPQWSLWVIYSLLALSLSFVWGHGGILSLGQGALFGVAAYTYGVIGTNLGPVTGETVSAAILSVVITAAVAAGLGYFMLYGNVSEIYVAIITLAFSLVLGTVINGTGGPQYKIGNAMLGGNSGMSGIPALNAGPFGVVQGHAVFIVWVTVAAVVLFGLAALKRSRFGRIVAGVRENPQRAQLLGYDVRRYKFGTFVIGGGIAAIAGVGYATWAQFVSPQVFSLGQAALVVIWVLVGGRTSLVGAVIGTFVVQALSTTLGGSAGNMTPIVIGAVMMAIVLFLPGGLVSVVAIITRRLRGVQGQRGRPEPVAVAGDDMGDGLSALVRPTGRPPELKAVGVRKYFGGVRGVEGVDAEYLGYGVSCLVGPNGAGKSTFFNLLVGLYPPTRGRVFLDGRDITRWRPDERARAGLGVKRQAVSVFPGLTVEENVWFGAAVGGIPKREIDQRLEIVLDALRMQPIRNRVASELSHGEMQWLEIGMVLAANPSVVLLDEPTAGMSPPETMKMAHNIIALGSVCRVVVVEHDMALVRELGKSITVFHRGEIFAEGTLDELRADARVLDVYLGRSADA